MSSTQQESSSRSPVSGRSTTPARTRIAPRPLGIAALIAGAWAVAMGMLVVGVPVLLGWAFAPGPASSPDDVVRLGVHVWLAANLVPLTTSVGTISLLPMGFALVPLVFLVLASRWAARSITPRDLPDAALLSGAISLVYAALALVLGAWGSSDAVSSPPWAMVVGPLVVALCVVPFSVLAYSGLLPSIRSALPDVVMPMLRAAIAGVLVMVAGGALLAGIALARQLDEAATLAQKLQPGFMGSILLLIVCIGFVPNAVMWGASFAVGPGFALGAGTSVTASTADTGALPAFPLLAAVPADGAPPAVAALALLLPIVAGIVAAAVLVRGIPPRPTIDLRETAVIDLSALRARGTGPLAKWRRALDGHATSPEFLAIAGAVVGVVAGLVLAILAAWSGGSLGDGRLTEMGPSAWRVGLMATVSLATVTAATSWALARRRTSARTR